MTKNKGKPQIKEDKISLMNFKINNNITDMDYVGIKTLLKAGDEDLYPPKKLIKALKDFQEGPAFIE